MQKFLFGFFFLFVSLSFSQDVQVSGVLIDGESQDPLEAATVFMETIADSTLITYTITDKNGKFILEGKTSAKNVRINFSYVGYQNFQKTVNLDTPVQDLGSIPISVSVANLDEVVVKSRAPITIKKDTLEFNVASFKTKKNATVEDLLKELPGVEVDAQGNITVNGKPVNKILVNGKPFFGDDPTIATRNLTKEIVKKIQVTDTKTDSEAFTGENGDENNKTINIKIDEEKNKGIFGRVAAGGGTDKRFEYAGLINYFDNDLRISALGGGNNTNSPGFSFGEIEKMFGSGRHLNFNSNGSFNYNGMAFGGGDGITNSRTAGANFAKDFGKKTDISTDYFYSSANTFNEELRNRENILPENRYLSNVNTTSETDSYTHTANLKFNTQIDSTFLIAIRPQLSFNKIISNFTKNETSKNANEELINQSVNDNHSERDGNNFNNRLSVTKKYGGNGGFFRIIATNKINAIANQDYIFSETQIFGEDPNTLLRNQRTNGKKSASEFSVTPQWRLPIIADTLFLNLEYNFENEKRKDRKDVFDFDEFSEDYTTFNTAQSTDFTNTNQQSSPEMGVTYTTGKIYARVNAAYVFRTLESDDALRDIHFKNDFNALEMSVNFRYKFSKTFSAFSGYYLQNTAPDIDQLSPFVDISDPLNITRGNPDLKPSNEHRFYLGANNYDFKNQTGFYSYLNFEFSNDRVVPKTTVDENLVKTTTFTNVNGTYSLSGNIGFNKSFKIDSLRTIKYGAFLYATGNSNVNFNNNVQYNSTTINYTPSINATFTWKDLFELSPRYSYNYSTNSIDVSTFENSNYTRHEFNLRTTTFVPKSLEWRNDFKYVYNADVTEGFNRSYVFWNSSLTYSFLKDSGSATLKVYDLLNQNSNVRRTSNQNYIQDVQSTVLKQYFMLTLSYKFNTLGKKGEIKDNPWD
ncbi:outer membrane beta-barrel protein [Aequorivita marisscotiae]|uniref:Outer membrane beta-barrel protein n=1 Tax=Aequorivita marisscotiae TaxID=3040348 RepID=A0ABY8KVC1_9FLAO|nr:outer membrane beta-barrel protein [Aequorivita sp. Ant34-E75]WGF92903.1 outer membrane beta-barrel protein [Aequorivita sp. Ant34-E75]